MYRMSICPTLIFGEGSKIVAVDKQFGDRFMACDINIRRQLCEHIFFCGGNTMFKGFKERIKNGLLEYDGLLTMYNYNVIDSIDEIDKDISAWIGGSILASLDTFEELWMIKTEYDESGPAYVHRHCC